ncbi:MAG: SH3 domain-containing protein [Chloroflexi bacterium]|nr:SH3 domain-containing protein [Chloroflexota bacterium]
MKLVKILRSTTACAIGVTSLALALNTQPALAAATPGQNLLTNPSHEHPGVYFGGRGEINVTWNWVPFWEEPPAGTDLRDQNYRTPEFRPVFASQYPERVHSGGGSDRWFNYFALNHAAGIMQLVNDLPIGKTVRFTTWAQLWSSNDNGTPALSTRDGNMKVRVCIQTDGGPRNMSSENLKCSEWAQPYDKWEQIYVDAVPVSSTVIALIQSNAEIPVEHNDAYIDDSCFEVLPAAGAQGICLGADYIPSGASAGAAASTDQSQAAQTTPTATPLPTVQVPAGPGAQAAVNTAGINVREKPAMTGKIIGGYKRGNVLDVTGKSVDGKWFQVKYKTGTGWVYASLTLPNDAAKAVATVK